MTEKKKTRRGGKRANAGTRRGNGIPRNEKGTTANQPRGKYEEIAIRRPRSIQLRASGLTWEQIGVELNCSYETARRDVAAALEELHNLELDAATQYKQLQLERYNTILRTLWPLVLRRDGTIVNKKPVYGWEGSDSHLRAVEQLRKVMRDISELLGLINKGTKTPEDDPTKGGNFLESDVIVIG